MPQEDAAAKAQAVAKATTAQEDSAPAQQVVVTDVSTRLKQSDVWSYYSEVKQFDGKSKAKCRYCEKWISAVNTTNLRSHVNSVHKKEVEAALLKSDKVKPPGPAAVFSEGYSFCIDKQVCDICLSGACWSWQSGAA